VIKVYQFKKYHYRNPDDVGESERAFAVNMSAEGMNVTGICKGLGVSDSYVGKRKIIYGKEGAEGLLLKYKGSKGYPGAVNRKEITGYIKECGHISTEELRDHIEEKYGVVYKSEQSYYDLPKAGGKSRISAQIRI